MEKKQAAMNYRGIVVRATALQNEGKIWNVSLEFMRGVPEFCIHRKDSAVSGMDVDAVIAEAFGFAQIEIDTNPALFRA